MSTTPSTLIAEDAVARAVVLLRQRHIPADRIISDPVGVRAAAKVWNAAVDNQPALVVRCASTGDVSAAVSAAVEVGLPVSVRAGGHDWAGRSVRTGAMVIDLTVLRSVRIEGDLAVVGGGATSSDVLDAARPHGFSAATGTVGSVGMAGLTLGGGYGRLMGALGLAADNLIAAEVVLADGSVVRVDDRHEPELFWALRGAGGNFGVVTELTIALHAVPEITTGAIVFGRRHATSVFEQWRTLTAKRQDELTVGFGVTQSPDGTAVFISPAWAGPMDEGERILQQIADFAPALAAETGRMPVADSVHLLDDLFPAGRSFTLKTRSLDQLSDVVIAELLSAGDSAPTALCSINVHHFHGAASRVPSGATAYSLRDDHLVVEIIASWDSGDGTTESQWANDTARALDPHALDGGYVNLMGPDDTERAALAYAGNAERVLAAKTRYDPHGVFTAIGMPALL